MSENQEEVNLPLDELTATIMDVADAQENVRANVETTGRIIARSVRKINNNVSVRLGNLNSDVLVHFDTVGNGRVTLSANDFRELLLWASQVGF